jgi:hypothetical protein
MANATVAPPRAKTREWITCCAAARILGVDPRHVSSLALRGMITVRAFPGIPIKYSRTDCEKVAAESSATGQEIVVA